MDKVIIKPQAFGPICPECGLGCCVHTQLREAMKNPGVQTLIRLCEQYHQMNEAAHLLDAAVRLNTRIGS